MITVDNPVSKVYKRWSNEIEKIVGKGNFSMSSSKTLVDSDRYARIFLMGNPTSSADLQGNENATILSFQVDSFASGVGALSKAYEIDSVSHAAMFNMGFHRTYGASETENIDSNIKRVTSRYNRIYTGQL